MQKLVQGIFAFQEKVHKPMREFFQQLADGQQPRALFITCCDSRVNPDLMTQAEPGELFMIRNAGNLVPSYGASGGGEAATIEYAIAKLGVSNVIVCGHSNCGAMKALNDPDALKDMPALDEWLHHAAATRRIADQTTHGMTPAEAWQAIIKINVLVQIENLRTHPVVAAGLIRGNLFIHAWYYCFSTGAIEVHNPELGRFVSMSELEPVTAIPPAVPISRIPSRAGTIYGETIAKGSLPVTYGHRDGGSYNGRPNAAATTSVGTAEQGKKP